MESKPDGPPGPLTAEQLAAVQDEELLNKMLDVTEDLEQRRLIRAALRELLKKKRDKREQERSSRQQDLQRRVLSGAAASGGATAASRGATAASGGATAASRGATAASGGATAAQPPDSNKVTGQTPPSGPTGTTAGHAALNPPSSAAPNAKSVKQMLLDWCRAKTEPYEEVDIQNFSSSWKDGIAFCALVHRFFPDAFEYSVLNPGEPRENFQLAFSTAERLAGCPPLLDADDLVRMKEPDWKCVYTYIQEFYRCLVQKGLVKTKKRP